MPLQNVQLLGIPLTLTLSNVTKCNLDPFNTFSPQIVDKILNGEGQAVNIKNVSFSPSGNWLVTVGYSTKQQIDILIWDLFSGSLAFRFPPLNASNKAAIISLVWGTDNLMVAFGDGKICSLNLSNVKGDEDSKKEYDLELVDGDTLQFITLHPGFKDTLICVLRSGKILMVNMSCSVQVLVKKVFDGDGLNDIQIDSAILHESGLLFLVDRKGQIHCYDIFRQRIMTVNGISFNSQIQNIQVHPQCKSLFLILKDKTIRIINIEMSDEGIISLYPVHKLQDAVNKWPWKFGGYSHDGELIWGTFMKSGRHSVYIWDSNSGNLQKILDGPKEDLSMAIWNPKSPSLITISVVDTIFRWIPDYPVKWNALVPGLEEIEENIQYFEREDEFDFPVEEELVSNKGNRENFEDYVDVVGIVDLNLNPPERVPLIIPPWTGSAV